MTVPKEETASRQASADGDSNKVPATPSKSSIASGDSNSSPKHGRTVSWGGIIPELKQGQTRASKDSGVFTGKKDESPQSDRSSNKSQKISLNDVVNYSPIEEEAQTHILRAVEKMQSDEYTPPENNDPQEDSLYRDIASEHIARDSAEKDKLARSSESGRQKAKDEEEGEQESLLGDKNASSQNDQKSAPSSGVLAKGRFKSIVEKNFVNKKTQRKGVEHTLFGLTTALMDTDTKKNIEVKEDDSSTRRLTKTANMLANNTGTGDVENQVTSQYAGNDATESDSSDDENDAPPGALNKKKKKKRRKHHFGDQVADGIIGENWSVFSQAFNPRNDKVEQYLRKVGLSIMLPAFGIAAFLYWVVENPSLCERKVQPGAPTQAPEPMERFLQSVNETMTNTTKAPKSSTELFVCPGLGASASWWFLFLGVRQVTTFTLALVIQAFIIDVLALGTRICLRWLGPVITMFIVQSRGWPFLAVFWSVFDLILLSGDREYAHHWGYWQDWVGLFNEKNPSGNVVDNEWNYRILRLAIEVGILVSIKRFVVTLFLGRQTFARFGEELAEVMKNMVLVGEVATLARDIEKYSGDYANNSTDLLTGTPSRRNMQHMLEEQAGESESGEETKVNAAEAAKSYVRNRNQSHQEGKGNVSRSSSRTIQEEEFSQSEQMKMSELLGAWEEPVTVEAKEQKKISIGAVLQFRQALTFMRTKYPFRPAFGQALSREKCIENASQVFDRLMFRTPNCSLLPFDTLALLAKDEKTGLDEEKTKLLIKVFRPDREGNLSKLDFVKSIDAIYKSIRLLSANISNSSQIDRAVESIINIGFYIILAAIVLSQLDVDPMQVFLSLSGILLAFAFMFGSSAANFFEGVLFILVHSPYGVGDRVHFSDPSQGTSIDGSAGWIVERVALYTTTLYWAATNERCTINNGALSRLRVINGNRSPNAQLFIFMKFAIDTPSEKFDIARAALEQYCKDRPREWLYFICFRPTEAVVEGNYVTYMTIATHRSKWQEMGAVLQDKSDMVTYQLEVCKQLGIGYEQPHLPVDVTVSNGGGTQVNNGESQCGGLGPSELAGLSQKD